jgi:hypothetical protein
MEIDELTLLKIQAHIQQAYQSLEEASRLSMAITASLTPIKPIVLRHPRVKMFSRKDKGEVLQEALHQAGFNIIHDWKRANFIIADHDQRGDIRRMQRENKAFFIQPHSARSMILWDGILPTTSFVRCNFVFAPGAKKVMQLYGYKRPVEVIGWTYCPIKPFTPSKKLERVLFAPIHPNQGQDSRGRRLMEVDVTLNQKAFDILYKLGVDLTVRYTGALKDNGLEEKPDVTYQLSDMTLDGSLRAMEGMDLIVGHQTFAYMSIASGIPTLMFGEEVTPHAMHIKVRSWDRYRHLLMYPLDLLVDNPHTVIDEALSSDRSIREWRENFIGRPFQPDEFIRLLETYLE